MAGAGAGAGQGHGHRQEARLLGVYLDIAVRVCGTPRQGMIEHRALEGRPARAGRGANSQPASCRGAHSPGNLSSPPEAPPPPAAAGWQSRRRRRPGRPPETPAALPLCCAAAAAASPAHRPTGRTWRTQQALRVEPGSSYTYTHTSQFDQLSAAFGRHPGYSPMAPSSHCQHYTTKPPGGHPSAPGLPPTHPRSHLHSPSRIRLLAEASQVSAGGRTARGGATTSALRRQGMPSTGGTAWTGHQPMPASSRQKALPAAGAAAAPVPDLARRGLAPGAARPCPWPWPWPCSTPLSSPDILQGRRAGGRVDQWTESNTRIRGADGRGLSAKRRPRFASAGQRQ